MKFSESLEASCLAANQARNAFATPKNCPSVRWWRSVGMTILINTDVIRNTSKEKFSAKKNHQISTIVCWYNDQLSAINKYMYLFNCRFLQEKWLDWSFLNQEEFPGNHQIDVSTGICRKPQTYKLWLLPAYDMPSPWYLYNII